MVIGVTIPNIDGRINSILGITGGNYLTRNETILPATFTNSSLNSVGTLNNLNVTNTIIGTSGKFLNVSVEDGFGILDNSGNQRFTTWYGENIYKSNFHTFNRDSGSGLMTLDTTGLTIIGNCTISGTLQSPLLIY